MARVLLLLLAALGTAHAQAGPPEGQRRFEAATALEARGEYAAAADALEQLGRERPDDPYADDALFEAALLAEERLADPARAARLYDAVATRYPTSRLARRARTRADFLTRSLRTGEAPLKAYQEILAGVTQRPVAESLARMEALLREYPDFAVADRALYWLGTTYAEQGDDARAAERLRELERRFPGSEWASRAKKARGDLALRAGRHLEAREIYRSLETSPDPLARAAAAEGLAAVRSTISRLVLFALSIAYLVAFFILHAIGLRRVGLRLPTEVLYYLPVAALFVLAGASENSAIGLATAGIAAGGGLVVWASTSILVVRLPSLGRRARLLRVGAAVLAVLAVTYISVYTTGLTDLVLETLRNGPER